MPKLILIIKYKTDMKDVMIRALECLKLFVNSESTKKRAIDLAVK